jgi:hypothetical protein
LHCHSYGRAARPNLTPCKWKWYSVEAADWQSRGWEESTI